jgi:hypothetical protein
MGFLFVECDTDKISDGAHCFADLYEIRNLLFIALMRRYPERSYRSLRHDDGSCREGMFIAGLTLPTGKQVTMHMKEEHWPLLHGIPTPDKAPKWDGHGFRDSMNRLEAWLETEIKA